MKRTHLSLFVVTGLVLASCSHNTSPEQVVSQKFVHKYGFDVSPKEWEERSKDGQIVEELKNGVTITRAYENGQLNGPTTYTFANSSVVEKLLVYDQGTLLKETIFDAKGMPIREDLYEFDDRNIITLWSNRGVPLSIEEYDNETLVDGKYFTPDHDLEAKVENGYGYRVKRTREGLLVSRDEIKNGSMAERTTYHPNGELHTVSHYDDYQLHGSQTKYTASGIPIMELSWNHGVLNGQKVIFRNGIRVAEIPYINGVKHGTEYHYDDLGNMISETAWRNNKKHGCCKSYTEDSIDAEWYHNGMAVDAQKFVSLENRERILAELSLDK